MLMMQETSHNNEFHRIVIICFVARTILCAEKKEYQQTRLDSADEILAIEFNTDNFDRRMTIGRYIGHLAHAVWTEEEGFNGKRPFGDSGWSYDLTDAVEKYMKAHYPANRTSASELIAEAIRERFMDAFGEERAIDPSENDESESD